MSKGVTSKGHEEDNYNPVQNQSSSILSNDLRKHYANHGVVGLEEYIKQGVSSSVSSIGGDETQLKIQSTATAAIDKDGDDDDNDKTIAANDHDDNDKSYHLHPTTSTTTNTGSRFIRLNPRYDEKETLNLLTSELLHQHQRPPIPVSWLSHKLAFYAIPNTFSLVKSRSFQQGRVYGMDVSSGAAVAALLLDDYDKYKYDNKCDAYNDTHGDKCRGRDFDNENGNNDIRLYDADDTNAERSLSKPPPPPPPPSHPKSKTSEKASTSTSTSAPFRVLDLCCAPGLKTCAIADLLSTYNDDHYDNDGNKNSFSFGNVRDVRIVGVDISEQRMHLCKSIIQKYHIDKTTCGSNGCGNGVDLDLDVSNNVNVKNVDVNVDVNADVNRGSLRWNSCQLHPNESEITRKPPRIQIRLYNTDGTTFGTKKLDPESLVFDTQVAIEEEQLRGGRKRMNKSARAREKKKLRRLVASEEIENAESGEMGQGKGVQPQHHEKEEAAAATAIQDVVTIPLFDRVLVDAECSTDGAVRHLQQKHSNKIIGSKSHDYMNNYKLTNKDKLAELVDLQKRLIHSGYRLLKPGGVLIYSTCSLAAEQNEKVVTWLLELYDSEAYIVPVSFDRGPDESSGSNNDMIYEGYLDGTVRFHPNVMLRKETSSTSQVTTKTDSDKDLYGGGFFLAKIGKRLL